MSLLGLTPDALRLFRIAPERMTRVPADCLETQSAFGLLALRGLIETDGWNRWRLSETGRNLQAADRKLQEALK